jgi:hypothetical protein
MHVAERDLFLLVIGDRLTGRMNPRQTVHCQDVPARVAAPPDPFANRR